MLLLLVLSLVRSDESGEEGLDDDATEMGLSFDVSTRDGLFVLLLPSLSLLRSSLASSGVSSEGGGEERSGLLSLTGPAVDLHVEAVLLLAHSKQKSNKF